ncbi:MAG: hypothetical protein WKF66_12410 [Pedobacter sp.]
MKNLVIALFLCLSSTGGLCQGTVIKKPQITVRAMPSSYAAEAVGVNTHLNYLGSVYNLHYEDIIKPKLVELGTKHIRDHFGNEKINERYTDLAHQFGIKLLLINNDGGTDMEKTRDEVIRLNQIDKGKPVVDLIEPANERDIGWKNDWTKLCSYLHTFTQVYKTNVNSKGIPLLGPSFADTRNSALEFSRRCSNAFDGMDIGNLHAYSGHFPESNLAGGWGLSFPQAIGNYRKLSGNAALIETECGYKMSEGANGHPAVSTRTAAKYAPRLVLERLQSGVKTVYFYQLINNAEDFGLLNTDGTPRLQFTALKNFIVLFKDSNKSFQTSSLKYSLTGDLRDVRHMVFQKSDVRFLLALWQGVNGSEGGSKDNDYKDINHDDKTVQLELYKKASVIKTYRPSFDRMPEGNGANPLKTLRNVSIVELKVPDHVLIVDIGF